MGTRHSAPQTDRISSPLSPTKPGADLTGQLPRYKLGVLLFVCYAIPGFSMGHSEEARLAYFTPRGVKI